MFGFFLAADFDLTKSSMNGRPALWIAELCFCCNIRVGTSEC